MIRSLLTACAAILLRGRHRWRHIRSVPGVAGRSVSLVELRLPSALALPRAGGANAGLLGWWTVWALTLGAAHDPSAASAGHSGLGARPGLDRRLSRRSPRRHLTRGQQPHYGSAGPATARTRPCSQSHVRNRRPGSRLHASAAVWADAVAHHLAVHAADGHAAGSGQAAPAAGLGTKISTPRWSRDDAIPPS